MPFTHVTSPRFAKSSGLPTRYVSAIKFGLYAINYRTCGDPQSLVRVAH
jgi:hypothetical protein